MIWYVGLDFVPKAWLNNNSLKVGDAAIAPGFAGWCTRPPSTGPGAATGGAPGPPGAAAMWQLNFFT